jgi:hypothetical protein
MSITDELRSNLALPADERQELSDEPYETLVDPSLDPAWDRTWSREIEQRIADVAPNNVQLIDADEVHADLRTEFATHASESAR